ncbi:MAG: gamma-glutamylcyclotransferase [Firmicutes bacterium]|nr:gamma-glutamylcyclotransferase [Bacillota bacterium]
MTASIWYFAYGSNIDANQMKERIGRCPDRVLGILRNWRLEFNKASAKVPGAGFANIMPCPGDAVEGVLYLLSEEELRRLDHYEGVPHHYRRHLVNVERQQTGKDVTAVTYVANPEKVQGGLKPTREYLSHLLAGADCLSEGYMQLLRAIETLD